MALKPTWDSCNYPFNAAVCTLLIYIDVSSAVYVVVHYNYTDTLMICMQLSLTGPVTSYFSGNRSFSAINDAYMTAMVVKSIVIIHWPH